MKEILVLGDVTNDFRRLGIEVRQTYKGEKYGVCEVTEEEYEVLCLEPYSEGTWINNGWCHELEKRLAGKFGFVYIKGEKMKGALDDNARYSDLLEYLCLYHGVSWFNGPVVCGFAKALAKLNNMKMSELFIKYQG